jgi:hypothetical protein
MRFSLRSLLILVTVMGVATWLCTSLYRTSVRQKKVKVAAQKLATRTNLTDDDLLTLHDYFAARHYEVLDLSGSQITDDGLRLLAVHRFLKTLTLNQTRISDVGLPYLLPLHKLEQLNLLRTQVSWHGAVGYSIQNPGTAILIGDQRLAGAVKDGGITLYSAVPNAPFARIASTRLNAFAAGQGLLPWFSDAHLAAFQGHNSIEQLELQGTSVTDKSVGLLIELKQIRKLTLPPTVTKGAADRLRQGLPQCEIVHTSYVVPGTK